jgi:hypothetical protein
MQVSLICATFTGLVHRLKELEPEFTEVEKEAKRKRKQLSHEGGLK